MAKKITAPHSYDPGKGRPKEYLAYLNQREMDYLRSINGNNMERGPRGLPSFPPDDAIGSSSKAPSKSSTSSGAGRDSSRGLGQGAGGAAIGRSPSGSSPSGGNLGGGGKSAPGSSPSSPGGLRGAGGNYGPGSGRPGTTSSTGGGYKGPSSPMGGQGTSFSSDTRAQQEAQVRDAVKTVRNSPAFRGDANSGGIRTLNVGPVGNPVNVGRPISSGMSFTDPIPSGTISKSLVDANKYKAPLTPGMTPEDMARRGAMMNQIEQEIRDMYRDDSDLQKSAMENSFSNLPSGTFQTVSGVGSIYSPEDDFYQSTRVPSWNQSMPGPKKDGFSVGDDGSSVKDEGFSAENDGFSGVESSGEIVKDREFGYPTNSDGSPITSEDIENMPEDVQREYFDKVRYSRNYDTPYPLTKAEKEKGFVAGVVTAPLRRGPVGTLLKGLSRIPGQIGEGAGKLSNPRKAVNEYDRLDPMKKQQMRERAGKDSGFGGGSTSITSPGGGTPDIGTGGKNEPVRVTPVDKAIPKPKAKPEGNGPRPAIYYKWDLGVDVPSPTDSDYTLYAKYLQEKAAAKAGMA